MNPAFFVELECDPDMMVPLIRCIRFLPDDDLIRGLFFYRKITRERNCLSEFGVKRQRLHLRPDLGALIEQIVHQYLANHGAHVQAFDPGLFD